MVTLGLVHPETCDRDADCAVALRHALAYAKGQSAYAARIVAAFAPCGFRAARLLTLNNAGLAREHQEASATIWLDRPLAPQNGSAILAAIDECAATLARGDAGASFAPDDLSRWGARPVFLGVELTDMSGRPEAKPPLLLSREDVAVDNWDGSGPTVVAPEYRLVGGRSTR